MPGLWNVRSGEVRGVPPFEKGEVALTEVHSVFNGLRTWLEP